MSHSDPALLIIGYLRFDLLNQLLSELKFIQPSRIFVSIDCDANGAIVPEIWDMQFQKFSNLNWKFQKEKKGIGLHVPHAVDEILRDFESVIVLEDDCHVSSEAIVSCFEILKQGLPDKCMTLGFMSAIPTLDMLSLVIKNNKWRTTEYFSSWGWATTRESWRKYSKVIEKNFLEAELEKSLTWSRRSNFSKTIWLHRFTKVADYPEFTWDFQMQYATFKHSGFHLAPLFRSVENYGFDSKTATNTSQGKPRWLFGRASKQRFVSEVVKSRSLTRFLQYCDGSTWAGDSFSASLLRNFWSLCKKFKRF